MMYITTCIHLEAVGKLLLSNRFMMRYLPNLSTTSMSSNTGHNNNVLLTSLEAIHCCNFNFVEFSNNKQNVLSLMSIQINLFSFSIIFSVLYKICSLMANQPSWVI